jgi:hypothetical protein
VNLSNSCFVAVAFAGMACSQVLIPGLNGATPALRHDDLAVLELQERRSELPCTVTPLKPSLGFDFTFHSGYDVLFPMRAVGNSGEHLTILFRVVPQSRKESPIYMRQRVYVPPYPVNVKEATVRGVFALGEGRYHVDWLMRDQSRVCSNSWDLEVRLGAKETPLQSWVQPNLVQPLRATLFHDEPQVPREEGDPLKVGIIVNFAPQNPDATVLDDQDLQGLLQILRLIARDPHITEYSLVACSLQTQQVVYRKENVSWIDFPAVGEALKSLHPGLIDVKQLLPANGRAEFIARLVSEQSRKQEPDALIIVGPRSSWDIKLNRDVLDSVQDVDRPIFYLTYVVEPWINPWRDFIGNIVKRKHGFDYTITHPKDLFNAWSDVIARLGKSKHAKTDDKAPATNGSGPQKL